MLAESGIGWLPYFLARADLEWKSLRDKVTDMPRTPPSELFHRQVMATFEEDALVADLLPLLGADRCMWASDYPHTDSTFPHSRRVIDETLGVADRRRPSQGGRDELRRALWLPRRARDDVTAPIEGFDHVSLPLDDADAMAAFYRALGFPVEETAHLVVVRVGDQMINFHRRRDVDTRRLHVACTGRVAAVRRPLLPRGTDTAEALQATLDRADVPRSKKGPVSRRGARAVSTRRASTCAIPTATCSSS